MRLTVTLNAELEQEIARRQPWMHGYHFGGPVYTGMFKHHDLEGTVTTSQSPPSAVAKMAAAFDDYMAGRPYHDLDAALERVQSATGTPLAEMRMLDIACATGRFSFRAAQLGAAEIEGVEIRASQVDQARLVHSAAENLRDLPIRFRHEPASADDPGYLTGERYDVVLSLGLLYHLADPLQHIANLGRLAGRAVVLTTLTNLYGKRGLWQPISEPREVVTKAVQGIGWIPYFRDLPVLLKSAGFTTVGIVENPLVRGLRPPLSGSRARRIAEVAAPPAAIWALSRAQLKLREAALSRAAHHYQLPGYFTVWATR